MSLLESLKTVPFLRFVIPFAGGIYCSDFSDKSSIGFFFLVYGGLFGLLIIVLLSRSIYKQFSLRWLSGSLVFLFLFTFGLLLGNMSQPTKSIRQYNVHAFAEVREAFPTSSGYWRLVVQPLEISCKDSFPLRRSDLWQITLESADSSSQMPVAQGNLIRFSTRLNGTYYEKGNPHAFNYDRYLFRRGISFTGFVESDNYQVVERKNRVDLSHTLARIRQNVIEIYRRNNIEEQPLQVLSALTLGMRHSLDKEIKDWFVHSGVIHVLAVSGLHVGIIFLALNYVLGIFLPQGSLIRGVIATAGLFFYALITGGSPSVYRAAIMLSVIQFGNSQGRKGNIYNLLCLSAFIILMMEPYSLFYVGFWLSHLAVAGIATFYPLFHKYYAARNIFIRRVGDLISVTVAAQLGTFPLSLHVFEAFPVWFLLSNCIILPLMAPILILSILLVITSGNIFFSSVFSGALNDILTFMIEMIRWLDGLPHAYVTGLRTGTIGMVLIYLFLASTAGWFYLRKKEFFLASLSFLVGAVCSINLEFLLRRTTSAFAVFNSYRESYIGIIHEGKGMLYYNAPSNNNAEFVSGGFFAKYAIDYQKKPLLRDGEMANFTVFPTAEGVYLGLGDVDVSEIRVIPERMNEIKGVVLFGEPSGDVSSFIEKIGCRRLIVAGGTPAWIIRKWNDQLKRKNVYIHVVWEDGAYLEFY
ncbi:ComEC/Rec2 family competence protein [Thermophagus sp. OGC60D27]|uniref:ComEC/Rec2 family competence protein n=1 Tax=Thermophagus sp. OGC60D27 TaxID=3458415 RepID=UPI0040378A3E